MMKKQLCTVTVPSRGAFLGSPCGRTAKQDGKCGTHLNADKMRRENDEKRRQHYKQVLEETERLSRLKDSLEGELMMMGVTAKVSSYAIITISIEEIRRLVKGE